MSRKDSSLRGSNHSTTRRSFDLLSPRNNRIGSKNKLSRKWRSEHIRRKSREEDFDDDSVSSSSCSFGCDDYYCQLSSKNVNLTATTTTTKPSSMITLPPSPPEGTAMFSNESFKMIYLSWDVITNMAQGKQQIGEKLFELLSDEEVPIARWFVGDKTAHRTSFVDMIDMLVSMLSPTDLDLVSDELKSLGKRHAQYNEELLQVFLPSLFQHLTDAFCKALKHCVHGHLFGPQPQQQEVDNNEKEEEEASSPPSNSRKMLARNSSQHDLFNDDSTDELEGKRPSNWKMVEHAWQDLFWYIRCQMEEGAMGEYQHQQQQFQEDSTSNKEYSVVLKSEDDAAAEESSSKCPKPWSFSSRSTRRTSMSSFNSATSNISNDSAATPSSGSDASGSQKNKKKKTKAIRGLPKKLRLLRLNSMSTDLGFSSNHPSSSKTKPKDRGMKMKRRASMSSIPTF